MISDDSLADISEAFKKREQKLWAGTSKTGTGILFSDVLQSKFDYRRVILVNLFVSFATVIKEVEDYEIPAQDQATIEDLLDPDGTKFI